MRRKILVGLARWSDLAKYFSTRLAISGDIGAPPATTSRMLSSSFAGGVFFSR
jgi:hypothetical protein